MAKIFPQDQLLTSSDCITCTRKTYTLWMKSLVLHSNGFTVYDSNGDIVYRVDNYDRKGRREVNLMDLHGNVLSTIKKKLVAFGSWEGIQYCSSTTTSSNCGSLQTWFEVKRCQKMVKGEKVGCEIKVMGWEKYYIVRSSDKLAFGFRIMNKDDGHTIAEAKQKYSPSGVVLSNDVLTMDVAAGTDHSLIMALVTVYGLICGRM